MSLRLRLAFRLLFCYCLLLAAAHPSSRRLLPLLVVSAAERTNVASLPGLDGALPSRFETGYVTVDEENGGELFYYFIESEGDPGADPVLLWINGGNRCSVLSALFFEIGPVKLAIEPYDGGVPRLRYNPYTWTKVASVLFVDSPVGAGFSFSRDPRGYDVGDVSSTLQLTKFVNKWFSQHREFLSNPLYVGGESYAGKLVPFLLQKISEDVEAGVKPVLNLKGYLVGNPGTGESIDYESKVPYAHGVGIISDQLYETILEHCGREDYANPKNATCAQALNRFSETYPNYLSYFWANSNNTRENLGIKKGTVDEWVRCHDDGLPYSQDIESSIKYHQNLTSRGYRVLVYSGDHDSVVPFLGTQAWVRSLNYPIVDDWRAWHIDGQSAGFTITYANDLTFATVKGGGHTAPEYQPERCLAMFGRWISEKSL
nr:serine carboxypeptidase-like 7 isoform X2 [Oryza sativa Japonica Group]